MRNRDIWSSLAWLGVGILFMVGSLREGLFIKGIPGPGFLPLLLGLLLIVLSLVLLVQAKRAPKSPMPPLLQRGWKKVIYTVFIIVLAIFLFAPLGYMPTFFLLLILLMRGAGPQRWRTTLLIAFFSVLSIYLVFVLLLKQQLPKGVLGI